MNGTYPQSPEQIRQTPPSVGQRLHVTGLAELLLLTATDKYVPKATYVPETSAQYVALEQTVEFTPEQPTTVPEAPERMPAYQPPPTEVMSQEEMLAQARNQIQDMN